MCTLTIVSGHLEASRVRLMFNRDERRARPEALPPAVREFGARRAILPIDTAAGGTWISVNDAGLAFCLLNRNLQRSTVGPTPQRSRGALIPSLLETAHIDEAVERAMNTLVTDYAPFRLVIVDWTRVAELQSDGSSLALLEHNCAETPLFFTSSGLGDEVVERPRRALFDKWLPQAENRFAAQSAFHRHQWPERPEWSVRMGRDDSRTVSQTAVELSAQMVTMSYRPLLPKEVLKCTGSPIAHDANRRRPHKTTFIKLEVQRPIFGASS